jgi:hypothetical protein
MHAISRPRVDSRSAGLLAVAIGLVLCAGVVAASLSIQENSGGAGGVQNPTGFLTQFQETGVLAAATPNPLPVQLSAIFGAPTVLAAASSAYLTDAGTAGDAAVAWTFSETVGIATHLEIEVELSVEYLVGAVTHTTASTVFVESQATAIGATLTFTLYWDAGAPTGITFVSESQIGQECSAVGVCP